MTAPGMINQVRHLARMFECPQNLRCKAFLNFMFHIFIFRQLSFLWIRIVVAFFQTSDILPDSQTCSNTAVKYDCRWRQWLNTKIDIWSNGQGQHFFIFFQHFFHFFYSICNFMVCWWFSVE